jgi:hypothetical protein
VELTSWPSDGLYECSSFGVFPMGYEKL